MTALPLFAALALGAHGVQLDATEVTTAQYARCVDAGGCSKDELTLSDWGPSKFCNWGKPGREQHPINCVDWSQASSFCAWAGKHLPTDEEWDAAAGAREGRRFVWGDAEPAKQLCWGRWAGEGTCAVGSFPAGDTP